MTGRNSDPDRPGEDIRDDSWAAGLSPEVNGVYLRLVAVRPENEGQVANRAQDGALVATLPAQAEAALDTVPEPQLVLIQTIDNDIRCDGTDEAHIDPVGASVGEALNLIAEASPMTQILVVSIIGRPATLAAALGDEPSWVADHSGTGMCDLFDAAGQASEENIARLTAIIEGYEAEVARVCATVPQCSGDGGALAGLVPDISEYSGDSVHLSAAGHARVAETIWPVVAELLEISLP